MKFPAPKPNIRPPQNESSSLLADEKLHLITEPPHN
jgi:hypothetical protein